MNVLVVFVGWLFGGVLGGVLGMLFGLGALALPGIGPLIAAGTLATILGMASMGVVGGSLLGGVIGLLAFATERHRLNH